MGCVSVDDTKTNFTARLHTRVSGCKYFLIFPPARRSVIDIRVHARNSSRVILPPGEFAAALRVHIVINSGGIVRACRGARRNAIACSFTSENRVHENRYYRVGFENTPDVRLLRVLFETAESVGNSTSVIRRVIETKMVYADNVRWPRVAGECLICGRTYVCAGQIRSVAATLSLRFGFFFRPRHFQ